MSASGTQHALCWNLSAESSSQAQFAPIGATIPQIIARPGWLLPGLSFAVSLGLVSLDLTSLAG
jgi:hypothetical protein